MYIIQITKKTRSERGKSLSSILPEADTQCAHNPLMTNKSQNQLILIEKILTSHY
jgi:hypothetical protein